MTENMDLNITTTNSNLSITTTSPNPNNYIFINDTTTLIHSKLSPQNVDVSGSLGAITLVTISMLLLFMFIGAIIGRAWLEEEIRNCYLIAHGIRKAPDGERERLEGCWETKVEGWKEMEIRLEEMRKGKSEKNEKKGIWGRKTTGYLRVLCESD